MPIFQKQPKLATFLKRLFDTLARGGDGELIDRMRPPVAGGGRIALTRRQTEFVNDVSDKISSGRYTRGEIMRELDFHKSNHRESILEGVEREDGGRGVKRGRSASSNSEAQRDAKVSGAIVVARKQEADAEANRIFEQNESIKEAVRQVNNRIFREERMANAAAKAQQQVVQGAIEAARGQIVEGAIETARGQVVQGAIEAARGQIVEGAIEKARGQVVQGAIEAARGQIVEGAIETAREQVVQGAVKRAREQVVDEAMKRARGQVFDSAVERAREQVMQGAIETAREQVVQGAIETAREQVVQGAIESARERVVQGAVKRARGQVVDEAMKRARGQVFDSAVERAREQVMQGAIETARGQVVQGAIETARGQVAQGAIETTRGQIVNTIPVPSPPTGEVGAGSEGVEESKEIEQEMGGVEESKEEDLDNLQEEKVGEVSDVILTDNSGKVLDPLPKDGDDAVGGGDAGDSGAGGGGGSGAIPEDSETGGETGGEGADGRDDLLSPDEAKTLVRDDFQWVVKDTKYFKQSERGKIGYGQGSENNVQPIQPFGVGVGLNAVKDHTKEASVFKQSDSRFEPFRGQHEIVKQVSGEDSAGSGSGEDIAPVAEKPFAKVSGQIIWLPYYASTVKFFFTHSDFEELVSNVTDDGSSLKLKAPDPGVIQAMQKTVDSVRKALRSSYDLPQIRMRHESLTTRYAEWLELKQIMKAIGKYQKSTSGMYQQAGMFSGNLREAVSKAIDEAVQMSGSKRKRQLGRGLAGSQATATGEESKDERADFKPYNPFEKRERDLKRVRTTLPRFF